MKLVIVNDCANVMHDTAPYFNDDLDVKFLDQSRSFWSKTFGIAWKIGKSNGDLYHCNYALQSAFLVGKLKHLDILHCHGSDVRSTLNSKRYGWLVRYGLRHAKKVLYAQPDIAEKIRQFRSDAIYLPISVDTSMFSLKTAYSEKPKALYFKQHYESTDSLEPFHENNKDYAFQLRMLKNAFDLTVQEKNLSYSEMPDYLKQFDVFIDRFSIPSFSKTCLEAMSCGLATVDHRHFSSLDSLRDRIDELLQPNEIPKIGLMNRSFVEENHNAKQIAKTLSDIYQEVYDSKRNEKPISKISSFLFGSPQDESQLDHEALYNYMEVPEYSYMEDEIRPR